MHQALFFGSHLKHFTNSKYYLKIVNEVNILLDIGPEMNVP